VSRKPEDNLDISSMPTASDVVGEEAPGVVVVLVGEQNTHAVVALWACIVVVAPDDAEVQGTGGSHDCDVGQGPSAVVVGEGVNGLQEERMAGYRTHGVVGDTGGQCTAHPGGVGEKRVKAAVASLGLLAVLELTRSLGYVHRPGQCKFLQSGGAQSSESHRRAGWGRGSRQMSRGTMGIWGC
jgi:hypothetical protein